MPTNPIRYTSRTFTSIYNDINSDDDLVDKPDWFKRIWAGIGDILSMWENASANQAFLRTAFTRQAVIDLCAMIDYDLSPRATSYGTLIFHLKGATVFPISVTALNMAGQTQGSLSVSSKRFEARSSEAVAASSETFTANASNDQLTVARVYTTGEKVRLTTTNTLPDPLAVSTDYYPIYVDDTHIRLATSLENAYAGTYIDLTDAGTGTHTIHMYSFSKTCYQQLSLSASVIIGSSDGSTEWQEFDLPDLWVLEDTLEIVINSVTWTQVDTFVDSSNTDTHYKVLYKKDGGTYIRFGNGTYGAIPGAFDIYADYAVGGGVDANVSVVGRVNAYAGSDTNIEAVTNPAAMTGGASEETIENAKMLAPLLLKARDRFVTVEDGIALCLDYTGVTRANIIKNAYGILSAEVIIVPTGGGNPSSALKTAIDTYLTDRCILESVDIRVVDPTYYTFNVTAAIKVKEAYVYADVLPFFRLCIRLLTSEITKEIVDTYQSTGIDDAITYINDKWTESFTSDDAPQIQTMLDEMYERDYIPDFGQDYNESELIGFIQMFVEGVDYCTWTLPALPVSLADDEIATDGALTLSEIP